MVDPSRLLARLFRTWVHCRCLRSVSRPSRAASILCAETDRPALSRGVILTDPSSPANFREGHRRTGLVLFILVVLQVIVGIALKGLPKKTKTTSIAVKGHPIQHLFHVFSGVSP